MCYNGCPYFNKWSENCTRKFNKPCIEDYDQEDPEESDNDTEESDDD